MSSLWVGSYYSEYTAVKPFWRVLNLWIKNSFAWLRGMKVSLLSGVLKYVPCMLSEIDLYEIIIIIIIVVMGVAVIEIMHSFTLELVFSNCLDWRS